MSWLRTIYNFICELVLGCGHNRVTRPFTLQSYSYKVCLDCGKHIPYSLEKMRPLNAWEFAKVQPQVTELTPVPVLMADVFANGDDYGQTEAVA